MNLDLIRYNYPYKIFWSNMVKEALRVIDNCVADLTVNPSELFEKLFAEREKTWEISSGNKQEKIILSTINVDDGRLLLGSYKAGRDSNLLVMNVVVKEGSTQAGISHNYYINVTSINDVDPKNNPIFSASYSTEKGNTRRVGYRSGDYRNRGIESLYTSLGCRNFSELPEKLDTVATVGHFFELLQQFVLLEEVDSMPESFRPFVHQYFPEFINPVENPSPIDN